MQRTTKTAVMSFVLVLALGSLACTASPAILTSTPGPTATVTATPTNTPRPSPTLRPTQTPDLAATQHAEELIAEVQEYYEKGYLTTTDGLFIEVSDFSYDWAQLGWYRPKRLGLSVSDFLISAHFKWDSALKNSDTAGCGFIFALQPNDEHYAVFLDRTKIYFRISNPALGHATSVKPTREAAQVKFDYPAEADFTLIVNGAYAYVLVNGEVASEYTLLKGRPLRGEVGLTVLSGTNKDYGTHCEMTNLHLWVPNK